MNMILITYIIQNIADHIIDFILWFALGVSIIRYRYLAVFFSLIIAVSYIGQQIDSPGWGFEESAWIMLISIIGISTGMYLGRKSKTQKPISEFENIEKLKNAVDNQKLSPEMRQQALDRLNQIKENLNIKSDN